MLHKGGRSELSEQIEVCKALDRAKIAFFAVPNGGRRNRGEAIRMKASGVKSGVPDLVIVEHTTDAPKGTVLEMKREGGVPGDVTANQRAWLASFEQLGWRTVVGFGAEDALGKLRELGYVLALLLCLAKPAIAKSVPAYAERAPERVSETLRAFAYQYDRQRLSEATTDAFAAQFELAGRLAGVDPLFLAGVAFAESRWIGSALGDGGRSYGFWQMVPSGVRSVLPFLTRDEARAWLRHPIGRTLAVGLYWARLIRRYGRRDAAVVYNCGPVRCVRDDGSRFSETRATRGYFRHYRRLRAAIGG